MPKAKRPMERDLIIGSMAFTLVLSALLAIVSYMSFTSWFYNRYNSELAHVITNVEDAVDVDDLYECVQTGIPSKKYDELQQFLNGYVDDFELAYLYISYPDNGTMVSVCSATSDEERASGEDDWPLLYRLEDEYTEEELATYEAAWNVDGISYFENISDWGDCYTACLPLYASNGERVALLCADVFVDELHATLRSQLISRSIMIMSIGLVFGILLVVWLRHNVTVPVTKLEQSARSFAEHSHGRKDPTQLHFEAPDIHTHNEIESLSNAITQMSTDMQDYVTNILQAEERAHNAEEEAEDMSRIAYQDELTRVKSKAAYALKRDELNEGIQTYGVEFALVMVDLNNLKLVNDTYGHEHGDDYLVGSCTLLCDTFEHSPVFRIGGDEFVVVLEGRDYAHRDALLTSIQERFQDAMDDTSKEPWERFSAAVGMAVYDKATDKTYENVFSRADQAMYAQKEWMKRRSDQSR